MLAQVRYLQIPVDDSGMHTLEVVLVEYAY